MSTRFARLLIALLLLPTMFFGAARPRPAAARPAAPAAAVSAGEIIAAVNALRASQGLAAYDTNAGIAAYAQEHSDYMAKIGSWTHTHSDGSTAGAHGYLENVATGGAEFLNAQNTVFEIWNDAIHMKTMVGYASGSAGVGVAVGGSQVYVTLNVRAGSEVEMPALPGGTPGSGLIYTPIALAPLRTATARPSGAIIHEVGYGQSLWAIAVAYGVSGNRIRELNGMPAGESAIWAGQKLLIVPGGLHTPTPGEAPPAAQPPTLTPLAYLAVPTRSGTRTPVPALTAVPPAGARQRSLPRIDPAAAGLVGAATLGLILLLSSGIKVKRRG